MVFLKKYRKIIIAIVLIAAVIFYISKNIPKSSPNSDKLNADSFTVYCFNVGQADAIFIDMPSADVLIDAGNNSDGVYIVSQLHKMGVEKIDYLIGTHPHEDHIGGMDDVVENMEIGKIYLPETSKNDTPKTKTYKDLLNAIDDKGYHTTYAEAGDTVFEGENLKFEILAPSSTDYGDLNAYSIVTKLSFYETEILFMGDAEQEIEQDILRSGADIDADIIKVGHHGSRTSSSDEFIDQTDAECAIISCGTDNTYGHPHDKTLKKLKEYSIKTYRTDLLGTVIIECDKVGYEIRTDKKLCLDGGILND